jgi:hypothetical protein
MSLCACIPGCPGCHGEPCPANQKKSITRFRSQDRPTTCVGDRTDLAQAIWHILGRRFKRTDRRCEIFSLF